MAMGSPDCSGSADMLFEKVEGRKARTSDLYRAYLLSSLVNIDSTHIEPSEAASVVSPHCPDGTAFCGEIVQIMV
jgi:hypothetical protein